MEGLYHGVRAPQRLPMQDNKGGYVESWADKHRPRSFDDIDCCSAGAADVLRRFLNTLQKGDAVTFPNLVFFGPPGTGKTSAVINLTSILYGERSSTSTMWINASDENGSDTMRNKIVDFVKARSVLAGESKRGSMPFKMVVLDECDALTVDAQFALRSLLERSKSCRFCLVCNYVSKLIPAVRSRCVTLRFCPLPEASLRLRVRLVCEAEKLPLDDAAETALVRLGRGDMRATLNHLQACALAADVRGSRFGGGDNNHHARVVCVKEDDVYDCFGHPTPAQVSDVLCALTDPCLNLRDTFVQVLRMKAAFGFSLSDMTTSLFDRVMSGTHHFADWHQLVIDLSDLEHRLTKSVDDRLQLGSLCAAFLRTKKQAVTTHHHRTGDP